MNSPPPLCIRAGVLMMTNCLTPWNPVDYMTPDELNRITTRRMIAVCLNMGWTYRRIQSELNVSQQLIAKVRKMEERRGGEQ